MTDDVGAKLSTLKDLHKGLKDHALLAHKFKTDLDGYVGRAEWKGNNADKFRDAWDTFRPTFDKLQTALDDAKDDVRNQHNDQAAVSHEPDRI